MIFIVRLLEKNFAWKKATRIVTLKQVSIDFVIRA